MKWRLHSSFLLTGWSGKNRQLITLTSIIANIHNTIISNRILPTIEIIIRKNRNGFRKSRSEEVRNRNLTAVLQLADFPEAFESIHRTKMKQILLAYVTRQERKCFSCYGVYKKTEICVCSPNGNKEYFEILVRVLLGGTLAPFLFIICLDCVLRTSLVLSKKLGWPLEKGEVAKNLL